MAHNGTSLKYRTHIDGLRALAVLSVVAYHLGFPLHGGFVGVDIFFTISGFLIGAIILRETADGSFTFAGFYERRVRRILPPLLVMLAVTTILSWFYLLPSEFVAFAKSMLAALTSTSNFYFWGQSGYFEAPAHELPLLHTWSLAVEEQFYVFLPICLVLLRRFAPRRVSASLYLLTVTSFLISAYGAFNSPSSTFYLPHTRAWELLLGTLIATKGFPKIQGSTARNVCGLLGLSLISYALLFFTKETPFPGLAALPPCLGTGLIIIAGEGGDNLACRLLSIRPAVFVGLISYSLYLWHWPLLVFRDFGFTMINGLDHHESQALLITVSLLAAIASWRFVERPIRSHSFWKARPVLFAGALAATLLGCATGLVVLGLHGLPDRLPSSAREVAEWVNKDSPDESSAYRTGSCFITSESATLSDFRVPICLPDQPGRRTILVLGDSHAAALWWGLHETLPNTNVMQATASGCKPVLNQRPRQHAGCSSIMSFMLRKYLMTHRVDTVLIEAHWDDGDLPSLSETLDWTRMHRIPVTLLGPIVQYDSALPRLLAMSITRNDPALPRKHLLTFVEPLDRKMQELAESRDVPYVSMYKLFCQDDHCTEYAQPGVPLQSDYGHLTKAGSVLAAERLEAVAIPPATLAVRPRE